MKGGGDSSLSSSCLTTTFPGLPWDSVEVPLMRMALPHAPIPSELPSFHDHKPNGLWFIRNDSAWLMYGSSTWTNRPTSPPVADVPLGIMGTTDLLLPDTLIIFCKQKKKTKPNNIYSPGVAKTAQRVRSVCHASLTRWVGCLRLL